MKKLYTLTLLFLSMVAAFGQTIYSENFGTPPSGNPTVATYTGYQYAPASGITYTGNATVRTSNSSTGTYQNSSGSGNVFFSANSTQSLTISGINTSAYASADLVLTFGLRQDGTTPAPPASNLVAEMSTDGTNWLPISYSRTTASNANWELITVNGGIIPSTATLSLRFTQNGATASRLDDVKIAVVSASCTFAFGAATSACSTTTLGNDMVTVTIPFTGGGNGTYNIATTSGTISGANPSTSANGDITLTVAEGTALTVTLTGATCNLTLNITTPDCKPVNELPYGDSFTYAAGNTLAGSSQRWTNVNSGDVITVVGGNLNYTGMNSTGNSVSFSGTGAEAFTPFTNTTSGTIYSAFLMSVTDMTNVTTDGSETYFASLTGQQASSHNMRLFYKKVGEQYQIGLASTGSTTTNYSASAFNVGDTVLIIMGYDFTSSTMKVWINPALATFNAATPATLTETLTTVSPTYSYGGFLLRQDSATTTPTITIDELRLSTDLATLSTGRNNAQIDGLSIYPNPLSGNVLHVVTPNNTEKAVAIFDVLGKQVVNTLTTETVNVSGLNSGVYIVKITEGGNTATRKLIIK